MRRGWIMVALLPLALGGCFEKTAESRLRSALIDSGLPEGTAGCMAQRMSQRLTIRQILKLRALQGEKRSVSEYVAAVRKIDDAQVITVTVSSAALCATGLG